MFKTSFVFFFLLKIWKTNNALITSTSKQKETGLLKEESGIKDGISFYYAGKR